MQKINQQTNDVDEITKIIFDNYVEGGIQGNSKIMIPAFHKNASIHGYFDHNLLAGPIKVLFDWIDTNPPATKLKARISNIDLAKTIATARVELSNWSGKNFTDQYRLFKENGKWLIVSKVFHQN